ncbi:MAG: SurA N-terminal domain-containing protein [Thermodesulfobacteriota bacterium]|nr:SurA N-terminal domain-containing protein [Thermodesulfobacteriota bacterium]
MLDLMRKHARSWFIQVILFAVIIVFVFWGVGSFRESRSSRIATVNDYVITVSEYRQTYESLLKRYRDIYKDAFSENLISKLGLKEMALEGLIERALLLQEAEALQLDVTEHELRESIMNYPAFQKDGTFDNSRYMWLLRQHRMAPEEFEESQKRGLMIRKVENVIRDSAKVSDKEVLNTYTAENESINIEFTQVNSSSFLKGINPSVEEINSYFSEHKERYRIPVKVNVQYLIFNPKDYESKVNIEDEEIEEYYRLNTDTYTIT